MAPIRMQRGEAMTPSRSYQVLIDSSAFVALFDPDDPLHSDAKNAFDAIKAQRLQPVTSSLVVGEVITILSHRGGQGLARLFLSALDRSEMPIVVVDEAMHGAAINLFVEQNKKDTSYVDCTDYVVMQSLSIPYILSFDEFHRRMGLKTPNI